MVKKLWLIVLVVFVILALSYYLFYQKKQSRVLEGDIYNEFTGYWEQVKLDSKGIDRSQIAKTENSDGLHNYAILKGYFDQYDEESQTLKLRAAIAFTQNNLFEATQLKLSPEQTIYCLPENYIDPNTGQSYPMRKLMIPVKDGASLYLPGEKTITFAEFINKSNKLTLLLIQLTENFDKNKTNYVKKIIVTGLCD